MDVMGIDIGQIVQLGTQVATVGAAGLSGMVEDDLFELLIGIAILIYEIDPG